MARFVNLQKAVHFMAKQKDIPGNTLQSQAVFDREVQKTGSRVYDIDGWVDRSVKDRVVVRAIKFRAGKVPGAEWMVIITAYSPDGPVVAFHAGDGFKDTLVGLAARLKNGSMKWKVDEYG